MSRATESAAGSGTDAARRAGPAGLEPTRAELLEVFRLKYGEPQQAGWGPRMRLRFDYFNPDDCYEALVSRLCRPGCAWLDVGCGRSLFPSNAPLARILSERCDVLVGVDPDDTLLENPFVHERVRAPIDSFDCGERQFDLVTMRMVAEHVEDPARVARNLRACTRPGGAVVIYTVNRWSPVPVITGFVPFALRHPLKRFLWRAESKDTFPTFFRMNTRRKLHALMAAEGFGEAFFTHLDDCRSFGRFRPLLFAELTMRSALRALHLRYPESCILGVYR